MVTDHAPAPDIPGRHAPLLLMYHSVSDEQDDPHRITVPPARLATQLTWLRRRGLRGVSVGELLRARATGRARGLVGLSFDDGYADFPEHALPLLHRHGCTATVYVIAGRIGRGNEWELRGPHKPLMTAEQVRHVAAAGMEIGSHALTHTRLTGLPAEQLRAEVADSRQLLGDVLGEAPAGFCYPFGTLDSAAIAQVRAAGYDHACAIGRSPLTSRHALPRSYVGAADTSWRLHAKRLRHQWRGLREARR